MKCGRPDRPRSPWPLLGLVAVSLLLAAGIACYQVFTPVKWIHHSESLRALAQDKAQDEQHRVNAIVTLQRNTRAAIDCLKGIEKEGGPLAIHATNALHSICVSLGR